MLDFEGAMPYKYTGSSTLFLNMLSLAEPSGHREDMRPFGTPSNEKKGGPKVKNSSIRRMVFRNEEILDDVDLGRRRSFLNPALMSAVKFSEFCLPKSKMLRHESISIR